MYGSSTKVTRFEVRVSVILDGGTELKGGLFIAQGQRLLDLLNDDRNFVPFTDCNGDMVILRKDTIARITPSDPRKPKSSPEIPVYLGKCYTDIHTG